MVDQQIPSKGVVIIVLPNGVLVLEGARMVISVKVTMQLKGMVSRKILIF